MKLLPLKYLHLTIYYEHNLLTMNSETNNIPLDFANVLEESAVDFSQLYNLDTVMIVSHYQLWVSHLLMGIYSLFIKYLLPSNLMRSTLKIQLLDKQKL